jgi:MSHA pilin protein MshD
MSARAPMRACRGATLIELVVAITIVAIAVTAILGAHAVAASRSADAMVRQQAVAVAESYLEEILLKSFADPDGVENETPRSGWDDVKDYDGLVDVGARDQTGSPITALSGYRVAVVVTASGALTGVSSAASYRVDVSVTGPGGTTVTLSGYRTAW